MEFWRIKINQKLKFKQIRLYFLSTIMEEKKTPPTREPLCTSDLLFKPPRKRFRREPVLKRLSRKKLDFEDTSKSTEEESDSSWIEKTGELSLDPSSPIKIHEAGCYEIRSRLAPCECYIPARICADLPCKCPKKKNCFPEKKLLRKEKVSLKCTCPVECKSYPDGQEFW